MAGGEGAAAVAAREWAVALADATGLPVTLRDERLSSHVAEGRVGPARRGPSGGPPGPVRRAANRARIDREAAGVILEDELAARELGVAGRAGRPRSIAGGRFAAEAASVESGTLAVPPEQSGRRWAPGLPGLPGRTPASTRTTA